MGYRIFFLSILLFIPGYSSAQQKCPEKILDVYGAIVRGDTCRKKIALVFTGDEFADGANVIIKTLSEHKISASFFLTGRFYRNQNFKSIIRRLKKAGHYLGPHSDQHLLYNEWKKRDSLLVTEAEFKKDLLDNYSAMENFGMSKQDSRYFIPPYEWYNAQIVSWAKEIGVTTVNFSPGTRSTADYTYPELGSRYQSSEEIYASILTLEEQKGLNGFILLVHIGVDARRTDKFYDKLDPLISYLKRHGYIFKRMDEFFN